MVFKQARLVNRSQNFFSHGLGMGRGFLGSLAQVFKHHYKLIAAQPANGVGFVGAGKDAPRDFLEQNIAGLVAEGVVQGLEMIQINQ